MPSPTVDELLAAVPPPSDAVLGWLTASFAADRAGPLALETLLDLPYRDGTDELADGDDEDLEAWLEAAQTWALSRVLAAMPDDGLAWCGAAIRGAWAWWRPACERVPAHDPDAIEHVVQVAIDPGASREVLEAGQRALRAMPSHTSPPPWVGHFYGALFELFDARLLTGEARLARYASCLRFCCVAPDGARQAGVVAAIVR
ncbi:MAG: hypothetical protein K8W52_44420 [Deltaproteobacteria bacterium]|nr:hypothetical protein [Deltaproteobacteria bacterium]